MGGGTERPGGRVVVVCGPTASGKTAFGVALAQRLGGEVVSADSMQVYRGMDIGTAKPTPEEMGGVPHHMLDVADPAEDYSVACYVRDAVPVVDDILRRGKLPIVVGGTGLYIDNLIDGREFAPFSGAVREELTRRMAAEGLDALYAELGRVDPQRQQTLHPNDEKRILRALEIYYQTGETMTQWNRRTQALPPRYEARRIGLTFRNREDLRARIDRRVDEMMERGLAGEVRRLLDSGVPAHATAMGAIGYKELAAAVQSGDGLDTAVEEVKLRSRQYAKRQLTWFRRTPEVRWIEWEQTANFLDVRRAATDIPKEWCYT